MARHARAIRCYEKCGFKREGVWKEASYIGGRYVDVVTMGLLRADFDAARP
jgi:RimJ/RimL family protein N-acetyltransferase